MRQSPSSHEPRAYLCADRAATSGSRLQKTGYCTTARRQTALLSCLSCENKRSMLVDGQGRGEWVLWPSMPPDRYRDPSCGPSPPSTPATKIRHQSRNRRPGGCAWAQRPSLHWAAMGGHTFFLHSDTTLGARAARRIVWATRLHRAAGLFKLMYWLPCAIT